MEAAAIVLAAGAGTRTKSKKPKVAHEVLGKPLVRWVVDAAHAAGVTQVATVVGHAREQVIPLIEGDTQVVVQEVQNGTAGAVLACADAFAGFDGSLSVLYRRLPAHQARDHRPSGAGARRERRRRGGAHHEAGRSRLATAASSATPTARWSASSSRRTPTPEEAAVNECNSGFYCFDAPAPCSMRLAQCQQQQRPGRVLPYRRARDLPQRRPSPCWRFATDDAAECHGRQLPHPAGPGHASVMQRRINHRAHGRRRHHGRSRPGVDRPGRRRSPRTSSCFPQVYAAWAPPRSARIASSARTRA